MKYDKIEISTQKSFNTNYGYRPIPDITIKIDDAIHKTSTIYLIEVKVDAPLNKYNVGNNKEPIDQIRLYQSIKNIKKENVFLLSKLNLDSPALLRKNILWFEVANLLRNEIIKSSGIEKYLMNNFIKYLEDNFLSLSKITKPVEPGVSSLLSIMSNIRIILNNLNIKNIHENTNLGYGWFGYDLIGKNDYIFIGLYNEYPNQIFFDVYDLKLIKIAVKQKSLFNPFYHKQFNEERISSIFVMDEAFLKKRVNDQNMELVQWIRSCCQVMKLC